MIFYILLVFSIYNDGGCGSVLVFAWHARHPGFNPSTENTTTTKIFHIEARVFCKVLALSHIYSPYLCFNCLKISCVFRFKKKKKWRAKRKAGTHGNHL